MGTIIIAGNLLLETTNEDKHILYENSIKKKLMDD